jgi:hypothetical protein
LRSVEVPVSVVASNTEAPNKGSFVAASLTTPETVNCANASVDTNPRHRNARVLNKVFMIV